MIVPIILYGSSILRKYSFEVTGDDNPTKLAEDLFETVKKAAGIGLAAPQAGILKKMLLAGRLNKIMNS